MSSSSVAPCGDRHQRHRRLRERAGNLATHWRLGNVKAAAQPCSPRPAFWVPRGSALAKALDGQKLLALFGLVMVVVGLVMLRRRDSGGNPNVRLTTWAARNLPPLLGIGFGVGLFSGFFGIGGGFLIVPGLMLATGMPLTFAIGTSLVAVAAFGAATAASYAISGLVDWWLAGLFVLGGLLGGFIGTVSEECSLPASRCWAPSSRAS